MTMAAACFPDAQVRVQEELDMVVGMDKRKLTHPPFGPVSFHPPLTSVPSWNDWNALPQLHAFISEAFRWRPVTPIGKRFESVREFHG